MYIQITLHLWWTISLENIHPNIVRLIHRRPAVRIARSCLRTNFTTSWIKSILSNSETVSFEQRKWSSECQLFIVTNYLRFIKFCRTSCFPNPTLSGGSSSRSSRPSSTTISTLYVYIITGYEELGGISWQCNNWYNFIFSCIYIIIDRFWSSK